MAIRTLLAIHTILISMGFITLGILLITVTIRGVILHFMDMEILMDMEALMVMDMVAEEVTTTTMVIQTMI
jgi:hypothetical protein